MLGSTGSVNWNKTNDWIVGVCVTHLLRKLFIKNSISHFIQKLWLKCWIFTARQNIFLLQWVMSSKLFLFSLSLSESFCELGHRGVWFLGISSFVFESVLKLLLQTGEGMGANCFMSRQLVCNGETDNFSELYGSIGCRKISSLLLNTFFEEIN